MVRLRAVVDPSPEPVQQTLQELRQRGVRWYPDYREMLAAEKQVEAVSIVTPIPLHFEMTSNCLERGLYVLLEKPPVPLIQQLHELVSRKGSERVAIAFQWICSREVRLLKQMIVDGRLGQLTEIRMSACWPRRDAYYDRADWAGRMMFHGKPVFDGPATNGLAHIIHNAMFFCGETFEAFGKPRIVEAELYRARAIEGYDLICFRGESVSGVRFVASLAHAVEEHKPYRIEVRGTRGTARIGMDGAHFETDVDGTFFERENRPDSFVALYENFLDFAAGKLPRPATSLPDSVGYVLTTNGSFLSSGGIHSIGKPWAKTYVSHDETGWSVDGIDKLVDQSFEQGRLFSELGAPWAVPGKTVDVSSLTELSLAMKEKRLPG